MLTTTELRWFKSGTLPKEITQWFQHQLGELAPPEEREDVYLYTPGCEYMGIKLRQGRLEIKWRKAELGNLRFRDQVEGKVEKWGKWLCEDPTQQSFQPQDAVGKSWVSVKKKRCLRRFALRPSQRKYQVISGESIVAVSANQSIDQGCNVELTELSVNGNDWWSLAFEAFGEDDYLINNLQTVASKVFQNYLAIKLTTNDSYAYPCWLSLVM